MVVDVQKPTEISAPELDQLRKSALLKFLRQQVGKPFEFGVDSAAIGNARFDCSSLVREAYKRIGLDIARTSINQATYFGRPVKEHEPYEIGDLLFFRGQFGQYNPQFPTGVGHVAIYVGEGRVMHTTSWFEEGGMEKGGVITESVEGARKRRAELAGNEDDLVVVKRVFEGDVYYQEGQSKQLPDPTGIHG